MFKTIKRFFMLLFLIASIICKIFLFNFYVELRKTNPDLEIQAIKFLGFVLAGGALLWCSFFSFNHVKDLFKAQSTTEKDLFAYEKQFQLRKRSLDLQNQIAQAEYQNQIDEFKRKIAIAEQKLLENKTNEKK